jgi:1-aminocyclopropane-1-carboxylate deaminase/D-cysteine desulfhydrase-like pyridoxal-dependent ACC family enzyme
MAGLIDHVQRREIDPASSVVFLHTGGVPALFSDRWPGIGDR